MTLLLSLNLSRPVIGNNYLHVNKQIIAIE